MIYIVGVNHRVQHDRKLPETKLFLDFIDSLIDRFNIRLLAEEWNDDASEISSVATSTVEDLAYIHDIEHLACDPTKEEREKLGIRTSEKIRDELGKLAEFPYDKEISIEYQKKIAQGDHSIREYFWLKQIERYLDRNIIFVCGSEHISVFTKLRRYGFDSILKSQKIPFKVIERRFDYGL